MKKLMQHKRMYKSLAAGLLVGLLAMLFTIAIASAVTSPAAASASQVPAAQDNPPSTPMDVKACNNCHAEVVTSWADSPHAHAFDDPVFVERWHATNKRSDCLACHTTGFKATSGSFDAEGVSCTACHGEVPSTHPLKPAETRTDSEYCGQCHTTTHSEWRLTGHFEAGVGCTDCHDAHDQQPLFDNPDEMCINCHKDAMGDYLENTHAQKDIGCVDCHALVIPPKVIPVDGIVPTGHSFSITPATCVACHTDALHAGFSLPGYEKGAKAAANGETAAEPQPGGETGSKSEARTVHTPEERIQMLENQISTISASNASRNMTVLFQGGVVGLVLGGSTAWIVASNARAAAHKEEEEEKEA